MHKIIEDIIIHAPIEQVYENYYNIDKWKFILSDVTKVEILKNEVCYQEFFMSVIKFGKTETVHTVRKCTPNKEILIYQPTPPPQVKNMQGVWEFISLDSDKTLVIAKREFEVLPKIDSEIYIRNLIKSLKKNLLHFKNFIEGIGIIEICEILNTSLTEAMDIFWDLKNWNRVWNPILKTQCIFDNNFMQNFVMTLEHNDNIEKITGVQIKKENKIVFYNIECPQKLQTHMGEWNFEEYEDRVLVTATRIFAMEAKYSSEFETYKYNFQKRIGKILECFKEHFE